MRRNSCGNDRIVRAALNSTYLMTKMISWKTNSRSGKDATNRNPKLGLQGSCSRCLRSPPLVG